MAGAVINFCRTVPISSLIASTQDRGHGVMNQSIGGDELCAIDREGASFEVRHASTGFRNDQRAGRHVPGMQLHFPESIESPRGHIAEVDRGGSSAPDALRFQ